MAAAAALIAALAGWAVIGAARAHAAVTIGSDLAPAPSSAACTTGPCTAFNTALPGAQLTSPINGVIVKWRLRYATPAVFGTTVRLKVIRPAGGGAFAGVNESAAQSLGASPDSTVNFATQQPIAAGDYVGASDNLFNPENRTAPQADVTFNRWQPPLANGATSPPGTTANSAWEVLINADVEPDADCDGLGDETQDPSVGGSGCEPPTSPSPPDTSVSLAADAKGRQKVGKLKVSVSGGGEAITGEIGGKAVAKKPAVATAAAKKKKVKKKIKPKSFSVAANTTKVVRVKFASHTRSVRKLRRLLRRKAVRRKSKAKVKLFVTDAAGNSANQTVKINLKP